MFPHAQGQHTVSTLVEQLTNERQPHETEHIASPARHMSIRSADTGPTETDGCLPEKNSDGKSGRTQEEQEIIFIVY